MRMGEPGVRMKDILVEKYWKVWDAGFYEEIQRNLESLEKGEIACINFMNIRELNSELMPVIFVLVYHTYRKTGKQLFFSNVDPKVRDYLEDMRFFQLNYVRAGNLRDGRGTRGSTGRLIPVYRIYNDQGIRDFCQMSRTILGLGNVESGLKESVSMVLQELMINGQESHVQNSRDVPVYAFGGNEGKCITFAVVDFGMGFYQSLLQNNQNQGRIEGDLDAIHKVLTLHLTGKKHLTGGMGYVTIENLINRYHGRLLIASGNAVVVYENSEINLKKDISIQMAGSIIFIQFEKRA